MNLKEISRESGLSQKMILTYINKGLITPEKEKGKYVFSAGDLQRLYQIASMQDLGATKEQIHQRYEKKPSPLDVAMANVKKEHNQKRIKQIVAIVFSLLFLLGGWWNNYRPLTVTVTVPEAVLELPKIHSSTYTYCISPTQRSEQVPTFFYANTPTDVLYNQVSKQHTVLVTDLVIEISVPVLTAFKNDLLIDGKMELDPKKVITKYCNNRSLASDYAKIVDYTLAS